MKNLFHKIYQHRYFVLFVLLFSYVQSVYTRISVRQHINAYTFTPEAALATLTGTGVLFLIIIFFIKQWHRRIPFNIPTMLKIFSISLVVYVVAMQLIGLLMAFTFDKIEQNFNQQTFTTALLADFLNGVIYGSFFLAYYYYNSNIKHQRKLAIYNEALAESKITQLKTQLNPHFLFNNLNVLDQLIEEDKYKASEFLNEFAEIYRYVLQVSDKKLVAINEELDFIKQYFNLIQYKYENAYQLHISIKKTNGFIIPLSLQLLIENAVQHNVGTKEEPVHIHLVIDNAVAVSNNIRLKRNNKSTSGRALNNLKEQYKLLTNDRIVVEQTNDSFHVTIPIIP